MNGRLCTPSATAFILLLSSSALRAEETVPLSTLDLQQMRQDFGKPQVDHAVTGKPLVIGNQSFEHGVGTHARSVLHVQLGGGTTRFTASVSARITALNPAL